MSLETKIEPLGVIKKCQELQNKLLCLSTEDEIMYVSTLLNTIRKLQLARPKWKVS